MITSHSYEIGITWEGQKRGALRSPGLPGIAVATPPEFQGHEHTWTPEHLFVGAVSSCLMTTFLAIAELSKLEFSEFRAAAVGKLEKVEGRGYLMTEVVLRPRLVVRRAGDAERAARILEKAERNCPISKSITSAVRLEPEILVESGPAEAVVSPA